MREKRTTAALLITILALIAAGLCSYLALRSYSLAPSFGCLTVGESLGCDEILSTPWSNWLGLPVSVVGAAVYLLIIVAGWVAALRPSPPTAALLLFASLTALGSGAWFVWVQAVRVSGFCVFCTAVHACGLLITLLSFYLLRNGDSHERLRSALVAAVPVARRTARKRSMSWVAPLIGCLLAAIGVGALAAGQLFAPHTPTASMQTMAIASANEAEELAFTDDGVEDLEASTPAAPVDGDLPFLLEEGREPSVSGQRRLKFAALPRPVNPADMPLLGDPSAEHVVVEALDYTCRHCRMLHPFVQRALERYPGELAFVIHHAPRNSSCNPLMDPAVKASDEVRYACDYAALAIGVWQLAPEKFPAYHDWLMQGEEPPRVIEARKHAADLVGDDILVRAELRQNSSRRISRQCTALQGLTGGLPALLFETSVAHGVPTDDKQFADVLQSKLSLQPQYDGPAGGSVLLP